MLSPLGVLGLCILISLIRSEGNGFVYVLEILCSNMFLLLFSTLVLFLNFWWELIYFLLFVLVLVFYSVSSFNFFLYIKLWVGVDYLSINLLVLGVWNSILIRVASIKSWWNRVGSNLFILPTFYLFVSFVFLDIIYL